MVTGAGHHIFADKPEAFNQFVNEACRFTDTIPDTTSNNAPFMQKRNNFHLIQYLQIRIDENGSQGEPINNKSDSRSPEEDDSKNT